MFVLCSLLLQASATAYGSHIEVFPLTFIPISCSRHLHARFHDLHYDVWANVLRRIVKLALCVDLRANLQYFVQYLFN